MKRGQKGHKIIADAALAAPTYLGSDSPRTPQGEGESTPVAPQPVTIRMRLGAGKYALDASEAEIRVAGARIVGDCGPFEFDLSSETWVDIVVLRA